MGTSAARIVPHLSPSKPPPLKAPANLNVHHVVLGDLLFRTWYPSYYPEALVGKGVDKLYVCQWCFKYSKDVVPFLGHLSLCSGSSTPLPGTLIYSKGAHAIYEVDGEEHQLFAQNLSLFAKLFLDNKSVFFDVNGFNYYILTRKSDPASETSPEEQMVGFFSKEKMSWDNNNLACILVFPPWQRQGLGKILMAASYELSKREERIGGPEKPLSELGRKGYIKFWEARVANTILGLKLKSTVTVEEIASRCWLLPEDAMAALKGMDVLEKSRKADDSLVVSKARVREWATRCKIDLTPPVVAGGFVEDVLLQKSQGQG